MEVGPRDSLKCKGKSKGAKKILIRDCREFWDLDLPASMFAGDVPFTLQLGTLSLGPGKVLKKRLNHNRQGGRKLFPTYLSSLKSSHSHTLCTQVMCRFSPNTASPLLPVCTRHLLPQIPFPSVIWLVKIFSFSWLTLKHLPLQAPLYFHSILYIFLR